MRSQDHLAVERLLRDFATLNDRGDYDALADLFAEDGSFARPSAPDLNIVGRENIRQSFRGRPAGPARRHLVADPDIEFIDQDRAQAHCYSIVITGSDDEQGTVSIGGFRDEIVRLNGRWKFRSRTGFTCIGSAAFSGRPAWPIPESLND